MKDPKRPSPSRGVKRPSPEGEASDAAPPDLSSLLAYQRGELTPEERRVVEERVAWSRADPRLLFGWQDSSPGEVPAMEESDLEAAWQRLEARPAEPMPEDVPEAEVRPGRRFGRWTPLPADVEAPPPMVVSRAPVDFAQERRLRRVVWLAGGAAATLVLTAMTLRWGAWQESRAAALVLLVARTVPEIGWAAPLDLEPEAGQAAGAPAARLAFPPGARRRVVYLHPDRGLPGAKATLRLVDAKGAVRRTFANVPAVEGTLSFALARGELAPGRYTLEAVSPGGAPAGRFALEVPPPGPR